MPEAGSNFMDWQQEERDSLLFVEKDFDWSEPPQRRRRRITEEPIRVQRRTAVIDYEPEPVDDYDFSPPEQTSPAADGWDQPTVVHSHFDEMMQEWNAAYGSGAGYEDETPAERPFDLSDPGPQAPVSGTRRTVVITGHGDDRYLPAPRQRRSSELRFHERSSFSPDRAGLWAVLLSVALIIGAIVH